MQPLLPLQALPAESQALVCIAVPSLIASHHLVKLYSSDVLHSRVCIAASSFAVLCRPPSPTNPPTCPPPLTHLHCHLLFALHCLVVLQTSSPPGFTASCQLHCRPACCCMNCVWGIRLQGVLRSSLLSQCNPPPPLPPGDVFWCLLEAGSPCCPH